VDLEPLRSTAIRATGAGSCLQQTISFYCIMSDGPPKMSNGRVMPIDALLSCVFKEWFLNHNRTPLNVHLFLVLTFFANLVLVHSKELQHIPGIIEAHKATYEKASSWLQHFRKEEGPNLKECDRGTLEDSGIFRVNSLYRVILVVMDNYLVDVYEYDQDGRFVDLTSLARNMNVILIQTSEETEFNASINFEQLKENELCLPFSRSDTL